MDKPTELRGLRCYCCGATLGAKFSLVSMSTDDADRVFVMRDECVPKVEDASIVIKVGKR